MAKREPLSIRPENWQDDIGIRGLRVAARGILFELLLVMHQSCRRGYLVFDTATAVPDSDLHKLARCSPDQCEKALDDMLRAGVLRRGDDGTVCCAWMVREEQQKHLDSLPHPSGRI